MAQRFTGDPAAASAHPPLRFREYEPIALCQINLYAAERWIILRNPALRLEFCVIGGIHDIALSPPEPGVILSFACRGHTKHGTSTYQARVMEGGYTAFGTIGITSGGSHGMAGTAP